MSDNQGRRDGESKIETHNQRPRENTGDFSGKSNSSGQSQSDQLREKVKDNVDKALRK